MHPNPNPKMGNLIWPWSKISSYPRSQYDICTSRVIYDNRPFWDVTTEPEPIPLEFQDPQFIQHWQTKVDNGLELSRSTTFSLECMLPPTGRTINCSVEGHQIDKTMSDNWISNVDNAWIRYPPNHSRKTQHMPLQFVVRIIEEYLKAKNLQYTLTVQRVLFSEWKWIEYNAILIIQIIQGK